MFGRPANNTCVNALFKTRSTACVFLGLEVYKSLQNTSLKTAGAQELQTRVATS